MTRASVMISLCAALLSGCGSPGQEFAEAGAFDNALFGREPSEAIELTFTVTTSEVRACGTVFAMLDVETNHPRVVVDHDAVTVGDTMQRIVLPVSFRYLSDPRRATRALHVQSSEMDLTHPLLPFPLPTTSDDDILRHYCAEVERWKADLGSSIGPARARIETPILSIELSASLTAEIDTVAEDVTSLERESMQPARTISGTHDGIDYLIIYDPDYAVQAAQLRDFRTQNGSRTLAIAITDLAGYDSRAPVPEACQGEYYDECYFTSGTPLAGVNDAAVPALFGMINNVPVGQTYERVSDLAGIIRATIRSTKLEHPGLKYVVLLGNPERLPPRFTARNGYGTNASHPMTLPTDFYFREPTRPWEAMQKVSYAKESQLRFPCGLPICPEPNTDWDTTHFVWPVDFQLARTFRDPFAAGAPPTQDELDTLVAVGRIHGRTPEQVTSYLTKLQTWENNPRSLAGNVIVTNADGVYPKSRLLTVQSVVGPFEFFGEGFGSGYLYENVPAECMATRPPENRWDVAGWNNMHAYQSQPDTCKPADPAMPGFALPSVDEVNDFAATHGFSLFLMQGHGSSHTVGLNTNAFNKRPYRQFSTPMPHNPSDPLFDNTPVDGMAWLSNRGNGFLVSSACDPAEYLGGGTARHLMREELSLAEYFIAVEGAGGVGSFMNYLVGYYNLQPAFGMCLVGALAQTHAAASNRIGDALTLQAQQVIQANPGYYDYPVLNRTYFGDPAAAIAGFGSVIPHEED